MDRNMTKAYDYDSDRVDQLCASYRHGGPLPRDFYVSPEIFHADMERIWRRYWLYAGNTCMIPNAGDWMTWNIGFDSVILVRGADREVRAFHNTCRHRGSRICREEEGHGRLFTCPYHAWSYELDGRLRTPTEREFGVPQSELGLHPVPIKNIAGLLFVALSDNPVSFEQGAAELAATTMHQGLEDAKVAKAMRYRVKANWKLLFENNRECYHCNTAHPEYVKGVYDTARFVPNLLPEVDKQTTMAAERFARMGLGSDAMASSQMTGDYWRAARTPLVDGWKTQSLDGTPVAPLMGVFREQGEWSCGTLRKVVFPNFWQHASDDHAVSTRITPIDATYTQMDVYWFVHKDAVEGEDYRLEKLMPFWQRTSEQDWEICEANQAGVTSPHFVPGPYSKTRETNVQYFVDWYLGTMTEPKVRLKSVGAQ